MPRNHRKYRAALKEAYDRFTHLSDRQIKKCLDGAPLVLTTCKNIELVARGYTKIGQGLYFDIKERISDSYSVLVKSFDFTESCWHRMEVQSCRKTVSDYLSQLLMNAEILDDLGYRSGGYVSFSREFGDGRKIYESFHDMYQIMIGFWEGTSKESPPAVLAFWDRTSLRDLVIDFERKHLCLESISTMSPILKELVLKGEEK